MRAHKFNARRTVVRGIAFASAAEAARYLELLLLARAGTITGLRLQPRYPLVAQGQLVCTFVGDFEYHEAGKKVVEDVKGMDTPLSALKRKLFRALYGIEVTVVRRARKKAA